MKGILRNLAIGAVLIALALAIGGVGVWWSHTTGADKIDYNCPSRNVSEC